MRKLITLLAIASVAIAAAAGASAAVHHSTGTVVVKAMMSEKMVPNRYIQEGMRFSPGTVHVKSGQSITFEYGDKEMEPHTLTIVPKSQLPRTVAQVDQCAACRIATPHLKNPNAPPGDGNPIVHWILNKGIPGLNTVGDSVAIQPGPHKSVTIPVTAPAGTTLYFFCAVHPWMQGKIVVG